MAKKIVITGVSSGIGFACARFFLDNGCEVIGIGRNNSIEHPNYQFLTLDLSDNSAVEKFIFPQNLENSIFIQNAGIIGEIKPFWKQEVTNTSSVFQINVFSVLTLTQQFIQQVSKGTILFISSGAANKVVKGWSIYSASKAALDQFARTLQAELLHENKEINVKSIAPGVVDTPMQEVIRSCNAVDFPDLQHFQELKQKETLTSPHGIAEKLNYLIEHLADFPEVVFSLREIESI
jgi:benzil reductase ((S)-benzoin forming)